MTGYLSLEGYDVIYHAGLIDEIDFLLRKPFENLLGEGMLRLNFSILKMETGVSFLISYLF